jgi:hypothetical protein
MVVGMSKMASTSAVTLDRKGTKRICRTQSSLEVSVSPEPIETLKTMSLEQLHATDAKLLATRNRLVHLLDGVDNERKKVSDVIKGSGRMDVDG